MKKSYWQSMCCDSEADRAAIRGWFSPLFDDLTPIKADILCDIETDREKKLRAVMVDDAGRKRTVTRTLHAKHTIVTATLSD